MAISEELFMAILSMDSYNRGYGAGLEDSVLDADEWSSGEIVWLLDVIAPSKGLATAVLANFYKVANKDDVRIHPIISRLVDADVLKKLIKTTSVEGEGVNEGPDLKIASLEESATIN